MVDMHASTQQVNALHTWTISPLCYNTGRDLGDNASVSRLPLLYSLKLRAVAECMLTTAQIPSRRPRAVRHGIPMMQAQITTRSGTLKFDNRSPVMKSRVFHTPHPQRTALDLRGSKPGDVKVSLQATYERRQRSHREIQKIGSRRSRRKRRQT